MSEQELIRFSPKLLTVQQNAALLDLVQRWHSVYLSEVGAGQFGIIGPDQRLGPIVRQGHEHA